MKPNSGWNHNLISLGFFFLQLQINSCCLNVLENLFCRILRKAAQQAHECHFQSNGCWDFRLLFGAGNTIITVVVFNHAIRKRCNKHAPIKDDLFTRWPQALSKIKIKRQKCGCFLTMTWRSLTHGALLSGAVWGCFACNSDLDEAVKKGSALVSLLAVNWPRLLWGDSWAKMRVALRRKWS